MKQYTFKTIINKGRFKNYYYSLTKEEQIKIKDNVIQIKTTFNHFFLLILLRTNNWFKFAFTTDSGLTPTFCRDSKVH